MSDPSQAFRAWPCLLAFLCGCQATSASVPPAAAAAESIAVDLGGGVRLSLRRLPAGEFFAGSPAGETGRRDDETRHRVRISRAFYIGATEVTQAQWRAVMGANPSFLWGPPRPAEHVSWHEAAAFCQALSKKTGRSFALPTEAQWEYACRAGGGGAFCYGDDPGGLGQYAWCQENATPEKSRPVGARRPNAWGLFDMHGNVREWCSDWYAPYPAGESVDPTGPATGQKKVNRGGSWGYVAALCRCAAREEADPDAR
ncbi:MAG: formylglycine-generating enzyme family protein, partial [Planctomycetota bacterium]|nr:formylglycine-generating enzyme family protein [Planctomycetota bacterium]